MFCDPFVRRCSPEVELGRTEVVYDNLNPEWAAQIVVTYLFEVQQTITVKVRAMPCRVSSSWTDAKVLCATARVPALQAIPAKERPVDRAASSAMPK